MAGAIKGITIEFDARTNKLDKAIKDINKETKSLDSDLRKVNNALKFNPTSVELWRQKQTLLTKKIGETEDKLKLLKQQQANMDAAGVDKNSVEYQRLRREIITTESQLKTFKGQLKGIGNVNLRATSEAFKELGTNLTKAGEAMKGFSMAGAAVVGTLGAMAYKAGQAADDLNTMSKVYGISTQELQKYALTSELVDVDVETVAKSHTKLEKTMMSAARGNKTNAEYFEKLGVSVTDANGELRDSDEVWQEVITGLGEMENETERDAIAMQLMGKSAQELNPLIADNGETYRKTAELFKKYGLDYIDQETLDKANEFNDQLDMIRMMGTLAFQQLGSKLAELLLPALEKVVDWVGQFVSWLQTLDPHVLMIIGTIGGLVAVIAPLLIGLGKVSFAISSIMGLMATLGPAIAGIGTTLLPVIAGIGALIAVGVLLYKHWDTIKAKAKQLWTNIKTTFNNIKSSIVTTFNNIKSTLTSVWNSILNTARSKFDAVKNAITKPIQVARETIKSAMDRIRSILSGKLSLPHIKLPHFSISGKFSLNPPTVPHLNVNWYKTGGIFDSPSVIGVGEAGSEAVIPLDKLWSKMDAIAAGTGGVTINVYGTAGMDVNQLAAAVEQRLVRLQKQREAAWV